MKDGATFHFVAGIESATNYAREVSGDNDVALGSSTMISQYLASGLIEEVRLHIGPIVLGAGTRLLDGVPAGSSSGSSRAQ